MLLEVHDIYLSLLELVVSEESFQKLVFQLVPRLDGSTGKQARIQKPQSGLWIHVSSLSFSPISSPPPPRSPPSLSFSLMSNFLFIFAKLSSLLNQILRPVLRTSPPVASSNKTVTHEFEEKGISFISISFSLMNLELLLSRGFHSHGFVVSVKSLKNRNKLQDELLLSRLLQWRLTLAEWLMSWNFNIAIINKLEVEGYDQMRISFLHMGYGDGCISKTI
ncbi:unnamed protein product [Trifolium pratense]|uniref:Uncharacterized protein n=1 Tax=Trifolium pratense TaxID=57577 RepID=A0ACB0LXW4_TRIPR|nr:unnamed protein product [Trifolium pratense]